MLLAIDVGNSSIKFGAFAGEQIVSRFSVPYHGLAPAELADLIKEDLASDPEQAIISSVVPAVDGVLRDALERLGVAPTFVDHTFEFGFQIKYERPEELGVDRLVAAFAAVEKYGLPLIVCDFGTAATIDAVNASGEYLGGIIAPGIGTMAESLRTETSKLPQVRIVKPANIFGRSTAECIRSGIFYGYIGLVEGIVGRMKTELGGDAKVIATGGFAPLIAGETSAIDIVDELLVLDGLRQLHQKTNS